MGSRQHESGPQVIMALFTPSLVSLVREHLMPTLSPLGYHVVSDERSDAFDNALVVVEGPELRIRVVRERSQVFVDFGSVAEPAVWFDSTVVMEFLGLRNGDGWHSTHAKTVLRELGAFLCGHKALLTETFDPSSFQTVKSRLAAVREKQSAERCG